ncbi:(Fe-S)-binding protein [Chloroflexota bacterium]
MKEPNIRNYSSLRGLFDWQTADTLERCTSCGACLEVCPVYPLASFSRENPSEVQRRVLAAITGNPSDIAREMAASCTACAVCMNSCPLGLNPYHLQLVLKGKLSVPTCDFSPKPTIDKKPVLEEMVGFLQIKPSQVRWLTEVPARPQRRDVVLFLGCSIRCHPEKSLALMDLMEMMGEDYVAVRGGGLCCGNARYLLKKGDIAGADKASREFIAALHAFQPKKVAFTCGNCLYMAEKVFPAFADIKFESMHVTKLLADRVGWLEFKRPVHARVAVHDSCNMGHKGGDVESVRKLIGAIPGVTLVEMAHNKLNSLCCGSILRETRPHVGDALRRRVLDEVTDTGADVLATVCTGCHRYFSSRQHSYPFEIKNYINIVAEAAGLTCKDKLKEYLLTGSVDKVIADAREYIQASPFTLEEYRKFLPLYFDLFWRQSKPTSHG